jgi:plastocyanin
MLKPGINIKAGVPLLIVAFLVSFGVLYGGAQLVKQDKAVQASAASGGATGPSAGPVNVTIVAKNISFDLKTITANAGSEVTVTLDNQDNGVIHNIGFYTDRSASQVIQDGALLTGPDQETITFTAPAAPGTYYFRCDVHPDQMNGAFVVQ